MRLAIPSILLLASSLLTPPVAGADTFYAQLVPRPTVESAGRGSAVLSLDGSETSIEYTIEYEGLSSPEIAAHIHYADGSIAFELPPGSPKNGVWQNPGNLNVLQLRAGGLYILVHTEDNPSGELRGDITDTQVPLETSSWSSVKQRYE